MSTLTFNLSELHMYGRTKLEQFAETLNIEGYEDMTCEMLREAIEEEALYRELKEIFG